MKIAKFKIKFVEKGGIRSYLRKILSKVKSVLQANDLSGMKPNSQFWARMLLRLCDTPNFGYRMSLTVVKLQPIC